MSGFDSLGFDSAGFDAGIGAILTPSNDAGGAGKGGKRKRYVLDGKEMSLNRDELEQVVESMLVRAEPVKESQPRKVKSQDRPIVASFPQYPDLRDMLLATKQIEAAQVLRAVAQRMADDQDESDVERLLLWE